MRIKIRATAQLKPGMVIRRHSHGTTNAEPFRQVDRVSEVGIYRQVTIHFTDGTSMWSSRHLGDNFEVARSKAARSAARARAGIIPTLALADALGVLLGAYALQAVTAR